MKKVSLYYKEGSSDKEYHLQLEQSGTGYVVNFQYGKRGSTLKSDTKTKEPLPLEKADKIYEAKLKEQLAKGYTTGETKSSYSGEVPKEKKVIMAPMLLNEIDEDKIDKYINDASWLTQEKKDGERRMVDILSSGPLASVIGLNKKGIYVQLPDEIIKAVDGINCLIDGEIIGDQLYAFDLLQKDGHDIKHLACRERIAMLKAIPFGKAIIVVDTAYTPKEKLAMYKKLLDGYAEGIVFKNKLAPYTPGRPASGGSCLKFKFQKTATFIVQGQTEGKRSVGLILLDEGKERFMGKVTIPGNQPIPVKGDLIEVQYLYAYREGCVYQPVYKGPRPDSDLTDATISQIIYKAEV